MTRNGKTAEVTLEQISSQEFQAEKGKMQIWKQMIMQEVAHELQIIKEFFFYFFIFYSCLTSMCNPEGYDRLKHLYIQKSSLAWRPLAVYLCIVPPCLFHDIWELMKFWFSLLTPNHQRVGGGTKRTFSGGNGDSKRAVTRDGAKVNEIREKNRFFQGQRAKIRPA